MSVDIAESYLLPPYSSVIGMVHNLCGYTTYHPMQISIQGDYETKISDAATKYIFGIKYDEDRHHFKVSNLKGEYDGITRTLGSYELMVGVKLVIHVYPENREDFDFIYNHLKSPLIYPSLGRYEDLLRIDNVSVVEVEKVNALALNNNAYIPENLVRNVKASKYLLNKVYTVSEYKSGGDIKKTRNWEKVKVLYMAKNNNLSVVSTVYKETNSNTGVFLA